MTHKAWSPVVCCILLALSTGRASGQTEDQPTEVDRFIVISDSEVDAEPAGEGEEIVDGYVESSYLLEVVDDETEDEAGASSLWGLQRDGASMDTLGGNGAAFDDIILFDDCSKSGGQVDGAGYIFMDNWSTPDGVPNF